MNPIGHVRRLVAALAGLACAWLGFAAAAPAALAGESRPRGTRSPAAAAGLEQAPAAGRPHTVRHRRHSAARPGWQIALIAIAAALFAATVAVLAYRAWTAHRKTVSATA